MTTHEPPDEAEESTGQETGGATEPPKRRRRRLRRVLLGAGALVLVLIVGVAGLLIQRQAEYDGNIQRIPDALPEGDRPEANKAGSETWLLIGSDARADGKTTGGQGGVWKPGQQRSDTLMMLHLPAERERAYLVSFPRDLWVKVPGHGQNKINAAFSFGGPKLLTQTVEKLTDVRIDHFAAIDFEGFKGMTDALDGVEVEVAETTTDSARNVTWKAGKHTLDGEKALQFVRQRYNLPNGDFDRIKRQQAFLKALAGKATDRGTLTNPLKLDGFLKEFTKSISVDSSVSIGDLRSLAFSVRNLRSGDITFMTVPNQGSAQRGRQSVVLQDPKKANALYKAVRSGEVAGYVERVGGVNDVGGAVK